jgi:hypothetical protein
MFRKFVSFILVCAKGPHKEARKKSRVAKTSKFNATVRVSLDDADTMCFASLAFFTIEKTRHMTATYDF